MTNPCINCKERNTACWGRCEKYQKWKKEYQTKVEYVRGNKALNDAIHEIREGRTKRRGRPKN